MNRSLSRLTVRSALTPMRVHGQGEQRLARLIQLLLLVIVSLVVVRVPRAPEPGLLSILGLVWLTYGGLHCARLGLAPRLRRRLANLRARASAPAAREASRSDPDVSAPHTPLDFRALADHALVGIFVTTLEGEWRYANAALAQLLEYASPAALMQQNARELYQQPAARAALLSRLRRGEPVRNAKLELRTQGGALRTVLASVTLEGDQITGMLIDSTERARAEARKSASRTRSVEAERAAQGQRFLTEASMLLGSTLDYDATLAGLARLAVPRLADWCLIHLRGSDGLAHIVAFEHADPCRQALRPDLCRWYTLTPEAPSHIAQVLRRGTPLLVAEIREEHLQAAAVDADHLAALRQLGMRSGLIVPLIAQQDCIGALTLIAAESGRQYDATDLALAEELARRAAQAITHARLYAAEQQAHAAAEAAVQLRDEFLSVAAHELQTPLAALLGTTQLMQQRDAREGVLAERERRSLITLATQGRRLNRLIGNLLDVTRLSSDRLTLQQSAVDLRALVAQLVEELRLTTIRHQLELHLPEAPLVLLGDTLRLEQVVANLLQNALKYSPYGGPVQVSLIQHATAAVLTVADQGIGIPAEALPQLFTRYYRAPNTTAARIAGLGIGLFVVKEIVERHGGTVSMASVEGQGSTFTVTLPLRSGAVRQ